MTEQQFYAHVNIALGGIPGTSMTSIAPSALYPYFLVTWVGARGQRREIRINPRGRDLDEVLAEFARQCREA